MDLYTKTENTNIHVLSFIFRGLFFRSFVHLVSQLILIHLHRQTKFTKTKPIFFPAEKRIRIETIEQ